MNDIDKEIKLFEKNLIVEKNEISRKILINTMENLVSDTTNENVSRIVKLPNDEVKGKLIGREGRNIRSLENLLGVNIIIDETPGQIVVSSFNPVRRAIAILTLETLLDKGVINQVTIEETSEKSKTKIEEVVFEKGKELIYDFNINDMDIEIIEKLGALHFRASYGQNMYEHTREVAKIAKSLANELGLDPILAARCALLHDIGKIDSEETGISHVDLGVALAKAHNENEIVINAIQAHHGDVEANNYYSIITIIADKMSAGRSGARRETFDSFIQRVESLEAIALDVKGVKKAYALQGGRELRIIVSTKDVKDNGMSMIALEIKKQIEETMVFPGQIKVHVIREKRFAAIATKGNNSNE